MEFYIDSAKISEIKEACSYGIVSGVTTNPSLVLLSGNADYESMVKEICEVVNGPVSAEITAEGIDKMIEQGRKIAKWHPNVVVKIPMTEEGFKVTAVLAKENIKVNMTLCFTLSQAILAARAGAAYVSPFVGRLDDINQDGVALISDIMEVYELYGYETRVIAASIRHSQHVYLCAKAGVDIATMPFSVFKQCFTHPLTDAGQKRFMEDWQKTQEQFGMK
ncbi:MAG: fructose-6-phosphate aldolase [Chloroflexi bacterium]|nr:fructose-6-phosphate aldolase [Chloroflexota bacterium]